MVDLDFNKIKTNLRKFLESQDTLKDYNYEGSALSTLLDVLAYNTQYNAYYLNMVANEMFLDTAIQRSSVVSHAKALNYVPKSSVAPEAIIDLTFNGVTDSSLTLPKFTNLISEAIDGVNYNFVTTDITTVNVDTANTRATFSDVSIKQGLPVNILYQVQKASNPSYTFELAESNVDLSTLTVTVQQSYSNTTTTTFTMASDYLSLTGESNVYFLQESLTGTYQIYFGDGVLGKKLPDGSIINVSYIVTQGSAAYGANNFVLMDTVGGYSNYTINSKVAASQGAEKESIASIKFQAPKSYAAQNRAVTKEDYITIIQQNKKNIPVEAVSVWGGEDNDPPRYGTIFAAVKPKGAYYLTNYQKQVLVDEVIKPVSVLTIVPEIVDVDYVYLTMVANIVYNQKKTTLSSSQISSIVKQGVISFCQANLNTFNSTFVLSNLIQYIQSLETSFVAVDFDLYLQKRIRPNTTSASDYTVKFSNPIQKGVYGKQLSILPTFAQYGIDGLLSSEVFFEESIDYPGTLRTFYYQNGIKNILVDSTATTNAGTIDFVNGVVKLTNFAPSKINSSDGLLRINAYAANRIISSSLQRVITLDENDSTAITVNVKTL